MEEGIEQLRVRLAELERIHVADAEEIAKLQSDAGIDEVLTALGLLMRRYREARAEIERLQEEISMMRRIED